MIKVVDNISDLQNWLKLTLKLYSKKSHYVQPIFSNLSKELSEQIFDLKRYTALMCYQQERLVGRVLFTYKISKIGQINTCYFSYFESIDDISVVKELFDYIKDDMARHSCSHIEGTYCPYDADNRRGILVEGFEYSPMVFTSYNHPYYQKLLEEYGFIKAYDTLAMTAPINMDNQIKMERLQKAVNRHIPKLKIEHLDLNNPMRHLKDIQTIMEYATTEANYSGAPDITILQDFVKQYKSFLIPEFISIVYDDVQPIGFGVVILNYNQVFKRLNGKMNYLKLFLYKHKMDEIRGMLQYVIPAYQRWGVIGIIYDDIIKSARKNRIRLFEASTIMEDNTASTSVVSYFYGQIYKRYRIYQKEV